MASPLLLAFFMLELPSLASADCNSTLCVSGCGSFDASINSCNFDYQTYGTKEKCVCAPGGSAVDSEQSLLNCLSCGPDTNYGENSHGQYGSWAVICGTYQTEGEDAAVALESAPPASYSAFYSASVLPAALSICSQAAGGSSATPTPASSTSSVSFGPIPTPGPTSTGAAVAAIKQQPEATIFGLFVAGLGFLGIL